MDNYWLRKSKKKKCDYRMLTDGEIKKLKHHDYDPEEMKEPDGSKADLFKCKGSGKVAIGRKSWHQDKDGNWLPGGTEYEDTDVNIDKLPWPQKGKKKLVMDEIRIEFRVTGLKKPLDDILKKLPVPPDRVHKKGEQRGKTVLTHKEDWFVYSATDTRTVPFDQAISTLVEKLYPMRQAFKKACGEHRAQLSCIFYFDSSHRPYIHFPPDVLAKLDDMGAAIDIDLYPMRSDEE